MKLNWGTCIVIAFAAFMLFILQYVYKVQSSSEYDHELVTEDYYRKELNVNGERERKDLANHLKNPVRVFDTQQGIIITFPEDFNFQDIKGTIAFYRPSNQKLDFDMPISLTSNNLVIPKDKFVNGIWQVTVDWEYQNKKYLNQQSLNVE
jgi:hypothetical protein